MKSLIWKDYRLSRSLLLLVAVTWVLLYLVGVGAQLASTWPQPPSLGDWAEMLHAYGTVWLYLTMCFAGLLGGHAIACERSDRSANFLACLPPTKRQILTSKLIVAIATLLAMWGWALLSVYCIAAGLSHEPVGGDRQFVTLPGIASICVLTFGVGWMASAIFEKTTLPILLALLSPVAVSVVLILLGSLLSVSMVRVSDWTNPVCFVLGAAALAAGTWHYCRRVEP